MSQDIYFEKIGKDGPAFFWGHGWGQSLQSLMPLAQSLTNMGQHWAIDFPGFGQSPVPEGIWGTEDYADSLADFIRAHTDEKIIWVGHSFGCRVGLQLAARHPDLIAGLCLIAAAGLPRKRPLWHKLYYGARIKVFKLLKRFIPMGLSADWLYSKFGSADYKNAGPLRQIFVKVVNEDLSRIAENITCPVLMIYGEHDTETPPEIGKRLSKIILHSNLIVMDGFVHYTILSKAHHQVVKRIHAFTEDLKTAS